MNKQIKLFFEKLQFFLHEKISPLSLVLDHDDEQLQQAFRQLTDIGGLKLLISTQCGGLGGGRAEWIEYNIQMAKYSGALLFLQAQHQFAIAQLNKLLPNQKVADVLSLIVESNLGLGISLAATRRLLNVEKVKDGYNITGNLRWVTGFQHYSHLLFTFDIDQIIYYVMLPFVSDNGSLAISPRIETIVFNSTNTVSMTFDNYFIAEKDIIATQSIQNKTPMEHPAIYNFAGAAKALLEIALLGKYSDHDQVQQRYASLSKEWESYYAAIIADHSCPLKLRARGLMLADRCAHFARMVCGAEGLLSSHPVNRISHEIWQYMIAGYSDAQLEAYLSSE